MSSIELTRIKLKGTGADGSHYSLQLNDSDISATVTGVDISVRVGELATAAIIYACDVVEIEGAFVVSHRCPWRPDNA